MRTAWKACTVAMATLALLGLGTVNARADEMDDEEQGKKGLGEHQHVDLGIFAGSIQFDDVVNVDNGPLFGIRGAFDWSHHWGVELVGWWNKSDVASNAFKERSHTVLALNLVYSFRFDGDQTIVPYVGAGGGVFWDDVGIRPYQEGTGTPPNIYNNPPDQNEFVVTAVAGLRFRATKHIAVLVDLREWWVPYYHAFNDRGQDRKVGAENESVQVHFAYRF